MLTIQELDKLFKHVKIYYCSVKLIIHKTNKRGGLYVKAQTNTIVAFMGEGQSGLTRLNLFVPDNMRDSWREMFVVSGTKTIFIDIGVASLECGTFKIENGKTVLIYNQEFSTATKTRSDKSTLKPCGLFILAL